MILVNSMRGLGDNVYQRPFVRQLGDVIVTTPWPELYVDLPNVKFMRSDTTLRTQQKNIMRQPPEIWTHDYRIDRTIDVQYAGNDFETAGIFATMERQFGVKPGSFDLPKAPMWRSGSRRPIAVIRPVTERSEWQSQARNPLPKYINEAATILMRTHRVISVADVDGRAEWFVGELPPAHERYHAGELTIDRLLSLVQSAHVVVGGVGWIVPMTIAAGTALYCVLGGRGAHNAPRVVTDPRMDLTRVGWATPDNYCTCDKADHNCDKTISDFSRGFQKWLSVVS